MEIAPEPVDLKWVASIEDDSEERYKAVLAAREAEKERRERAVRDELKEQNAGQPDLEKRYAKQEGDVTVGARPPMFEKRIVRDRHSGKLMEIDMNPEVPHRRGRPGSQLRLHQRRGSSRGS